MMNNNFDLEVFVGSTRGALAYSQCKPDFKTKYDLKGVGPKNEITAMEWGFNPDEIFLGLNNGEVKTYNTLASSYIHTIETEGKGAVVGIGSYEKGTVVGRFDGTINLCSKKRIDSFSLNLSEEGSLNCLKYNPGRHVIAVGGEKNDLKIFNLLDKEAIFKAKSLGHDELNLPIPTSVRDICFFPVEDQLIACATKEGHILLYDEKAQRKPIVKFFESKASYTTIAPAYRDRQCLVGTTKGYMQLIDLRQNKCLKTFKSFAGCVSGIACDPCNPYVVSTSLDRFLRIHNLETKELLYKEYMKLGLTKLIVKPIIKEEPDAEQPQDVPEDEEYENLFENMETIEENESPSKKVKRKLKSNKKKVVKKNKIE